MTLFSKIINREIPSEILYEDEHCVAFRDIHPQAPVHILIVPRKEIPTLADISYAMDQMLLGHLLAVVPKIAEQQGIKNAFRVVINSGKGAGQSVFHLHLHLLGGRTMAEHNL